MFVPVRLSSKTRKFGGGVIAVVVALIATGLAVVPAPALGQKAQSAQTELTTKARQAILMDADGAVLFQHKPTNSCAREHEQAHGAGVMFKALKARPVKLADEC